MKMRRSDRQVNDITSIKKIIDMCKVCRIAFLDEEGLYIVPLNYGYELTSDGSIIFYMHSAKEGRKVNAIRCAKEGLDVAVELDAGHKLVEGKTACEYGFAYASIIGNGKAYIVDSVYEKKDALKRLMLHQAEKDFEFNDEMADSVEIIKVVVDSYTAKEKPAPAEEYHEAGHENSKAAAKCENAYAFVDGSYNSATNVYGYGGFVVAGSEKYIIQGSGNDPEMASMHNVAGEVSGSMAAIKKALELGIKRLTVYYDYMGIEMWATGGWKRNKKGTIQYYDFIQSVSNDIELEFVKVKGHSGIEGNEEADRLAKKAVGIS